MTLISDGIYSSFKATESYDSIHFFQIADRLFIYFCSGGGANLTNLTISCEAHPNSAAKQQV